MADLDGAGPVLIAPGPRCPEHGQMREDFARDRWTCAGWDGEGCGYRVTGEDLDSAPLTPGENSPPGWNSDPDFPDGSLITSG